MRADAIFGWILDTHIIFTKNTKTDQNNET